MSHYAIVPKGDSVKLPSNAETKDIREEVAEIYQSYAEAYPNPRLIEENQERDRLLRAISAASHAAELNPPKKRKNGLLSFLWGGGAAEKEQPASQVPPLEPDDDRLVYTEFYQEEDDDSLCGTKYSLDTSCIPEEAHSLARFHLSSMRTRGERPNVARSSWERPGKTVLIVTGLGELVEFRNGEEARVQFTSDRGDLLAFNADTGSAFRVAYSRAATIGPNFLIVSWGMMDGFVVFYRRLATGKDTVWEALAVLGPTEAVRENVGDVFLDESGSALLRVTDVLPVVVETGKIPAATLAVSRLGGYIELVPLPHRLWYGPEIKPPGDKRRKRKRRQAKRAHYGAKLPDLSANQSTVTALTTSEYHRDVIGLEAFRTRLDKDSTWNTDLYPDSPPAEHVLAAFGTREGNESISFWTVSTLFAEAPEPDDDIGFTIHASLTEALELGPVGPEISIFANKAIMKYWRMPRSVVLREAVDEPATQNGQPTSEHSRVTTVSISAPVIALRFRVVEDAIHLAVLDWNGGATLLDCGLLERVASQNLSDSEFDLIYKTEDSAAVVPLAKKVVDRSHTFLGLSDVGNLSTRIVDMRWLNGHVTGATGEDSSVAILTSNPCRLSVFSTKDLERQSPSMSIPFHCEHGALLGNLDSEGLILIALNLMLSGHENRLSLCMMRQLDPRRIVESLFRESKYVEAIAAAKHLNFEDGNAVRDVVESCRKQLWEDTREMDMLVEISDNSYVVKETLSFSEPSGSDGLALFRSVHEVALQRVENARLGPSLAIAGLDGTKALVAELSERLIKLGTYKLLCRYFSLDPSPSQFLNEFLPTSVQDLAQSFAKAADVVALSLFWFRHRGSVVKEFSILDEIPLTADPQSIQHLLPVRDEKKGKAYFMSGTRGDRQLHEWTRMPKYLVETLDVVVALDDEDEKLVLESCVDSDRGEVNAKGMDSLLQWYVARAHGIQAFSGSLQYSADFVEMAFTATSVDLEASPTALQTTASSELRQIRNHTETLRNLLVDRMEDDYAPLASATLQASDLQKMELVDFVGLVLGSQRDPVEAFMRFNRSIRPLLDSFVGPSGVCSEKSLEEAVTSYCIRLLRECFSGDDTAEKYEELRRALDVSSAVASLSRTSIAAHDRLIKDRTRFISFTFSTIFYTLKSCRGMTMPDSDLLYIIKAFWTLYEALPIISAPVEKDDEGFVEKADRLFVGLVAAEIISQWPGCDGLAIMNDLIVESEDGPVQDFPKSGQRIVSYLCRSFCAQVGHGESPSEAQERSELLASLLSDVDELNRICFGGSLPIVRFSPSFLFEPLLRQRQIHLLNDFLSKADAAYIDKDCSSKAVACYVHEAVFGDNGGKDQAEILRAVMSIQDNLGHWFPELETEFVKVRRYVDAAHFINTVILADSQMTGLSPEDLRKQLPLDVIESVLVKSSRCIVCDCREWDEEESAQLANARIRKHFEDRGARDDSSEYANLPPLPGRAVVHLAELLGLSSDGSIIAVKCRVAFYAVESNLFGAAAAVCRSMIFSLPKVGPTTHAAPVLEAVAATVARPDYADNVTKRELCVAVLGKIQGQLSSTMLRPFDQVMEVCRAAEQQITDFAREGTVAEVLVPSIERLHRDTAFEYSASLRELFTTLQLQTSDCAVDKSLLNALSRYAAFWCIAQSTRARPGDPNEHQKADTQSILALACSLILHIPDDKLSQDCLQEVQKVLKEQAALAGSQKPTDLLSKKWDEDVVRRLVGRGYSELGARRACIMSQTGSFDAALQWAVSHSLDKDFDDPIVVLKPREAAFIDHDGISRLQTTLNFLEDLVSGGKDTRLVAGEPTSLATSEPRPVSRHKQSGSVASGTQSYEEAPRDATASKVGNLPAQGIHQASHTTSVSERSRQSTTKPVSKMQIHDSSKDSRRSAPEIPKSRSSTQATATREHFVSNRRELQVSEQEPQRAKPASVPQRLTKPVSSKPQELLHTKASIATNRSAKAAIRTSTNTEPPAKSHRKLIVPERSDPQQGKEVRTPDRSTLRERGQTVLKEVRSTGSPTDEERKRLIEEGRRLLQKARRAKSSTAEDAVPNGSARAATTTHRYSLRSTAARAARTGRQGQAVAPRQVGSPPTRAPANGERQNEIDDGWESDVDI